MIKKDQATNLRILAGERQNHSAAANEPFTIIVASGKGGVGKSFLSLHLSRALAMGNEKVLLVDGNLQNPSLHILTNTDPEFPVSYWLNNSEPIHKSALLPIAENLDLLANSPFVTESRHYTMDDPNLFMEILKPIASRYAFVVVDTQTGLNQWNLSLQSNADLTLLLSISDPTSVIDTYTFIKAAMPYLNEPNLGLVVNQVIGRESGFEAHKNLNLALSHFLNFEIELYSLIPFDMEVKKAGLEQRPLWQFAPKSQAMKTIIKMVQHIQKQFPQSNSLNYPQYQEVNS